MNILKSIALVLVGAIMCLGLSACDGKEFMQRVVAQSYTVTVQVEQYVTNLDSTNVVQKIQSLEVPLKAMSMSIKYIAEKVKDTGVKASLYNVAINIDNVVGAAMSAQPEQVDSLKAQILSGTVKVKESLQLAAEYLGLQLNTIKSRGDISIGEIMVNANELNAMLRSAK